MEVDNFYASIRYWWLSSRITLEACVHELANWLNFWHFCVRKWRGFMVHVSISLTTSFNSVSLMFIQNWNSIYTQIPSTLHFHLCLHLCCDILDFVDFSFPFLCKSSMMKSGLTCPLAIWSKLCITSGCISQENVALVCIQWYLTTTFVFSNNLHCIDNICKVVHLVMVLIGMNCCWGGFEGQVIMLALLQ